MKRRTWRFAPDSFCYNTAMTKEEKIRFRGEMEARTLKFAADVAALLRRFGGDENRNTRLHAKSSTSIGANYREANRAETVSDFLHKIGIVLKEADETHFWLGLVLSIDPEIEDGKRLCDESLELVKIFQSIKTKTRTYLRGKGELS